MDKMEGHVDLCRSCGGRRLERFFDLGKHPCANSFTDSRVEDEITYPLSLVRCPDCALIQLDHTVDPGKLFSKYVWVSGTSPTTIGYSKRFFDMVDERKRGLDPGYIFEAASNDGTFLKPFLENGFKVLGMDPAANIVELADQNGVRTECGFFGEDAARKVVEKYGEAGIVIARNVLPHVANLTDFVKGLSIVVSDAGLLVVEFHYAGAILEDLHYDSIYHEHLFYYTLKSAELLFNRYGLFVQDIERSPINAGNIILFIRKGEASGNDIVCSYRNKEEVSGINELSVWKTFAVRADNHRKELLAVLRRIRDDGNIIAGYGASARSSTLLNFCGIGPELLTDIADKNVMKQKKYTPGTHIRIVSPAELMENDPDHVLILAWNFKDEIIDDLRKNYGYSGGFIVPLPSIDVVEGRCYAHGNS
ncbi:MAG: class I SAM-dependent methyltransferase [Candidatus Omnitrophica bacterium]|nr:class I SAM-dependent methyltransferase [Candidatus Omnitrophota bacterium]